jgi:hypothetical protein
MGGAGGQDQGPCDGGPQLFCQNGMPVCSLSQCN